MGAESQEPRTSLAGRERASRELMEVPRMHATLGGLLPAPTQSRRIHHTIHHVALSPGLALGRGHPCPTAAYRAASGALLARLLGLAAAICCAPLLCKASVELSLPRQPSTCSASTGRGCGPLMRIRVYINHLLRATARSSAWLVPSSSSSLFSLAYCFLADCARASP
jgi:hypothetical protein